MFSVCLITYIGRVDIVYSHIRNKLDCKKSRIRETLNLSTDADSITIAMKRKKT